MTARRKAKAQKRRAISTDMLERLESWNLRIPKVYIISRTTETGWTQNLQILKDGLEKLAGFLMFSLDCKDAAAKALRVAWQVGESKLDAHPCLTRILDR